MYVLVFLITLVVAWVICFVTRELASNRCKHVWEIKEVATLTYRDFGVRRVFGKRYVLRCKNCGDIKSREVSVEA